MSERPPNCRIAEIACIFPKYMHCRLPPKLAGNRCRRTGVSSHTVDIVHISSYRHADQSTLERVVRPVFSSPETPDDEPYSQSVDGLLPGRRYRVTVAANTSVGFGESTTVFMHTLVAAPVVRGEPRVRTASTTDSTVLLALPRAESGGGPVSSYLVVVSTDSEFDGSQLEPHRVPNAEESREANLSYYITAALGTVGKGVVELLFYESIPYLSNVELL